MIQTNVFERYLKRIIFDMEPKDINKPRGRENTRVSEKIRHVILKPCNNLRVTAKKSIALLIL
jgi:hypothetical protein